MHPAAGGWPFAGPRKYRRANGESIRHVTGIGNNPEILGLECDSAAADQSIVDWAGLKYYKLCHRWNHP